MPLWWWVHLFYKCGSAFSHISTPKWLCRSSPPFRHLQHFYILKPWNICIKHQHTSEYFMLSTHVLQHIAKTFTHLQTNILSYPKHSRNTMLHHWTSSCTKAHICKILSIIYTCHAEHLQNLTKHLDINWFDSTAFLVHWYISEYFYCARTHTHTFSGLHYSLSIWHFAHFC